MVRYCRLSNVFETFSCKIEDPHVFSHIGIKVAESFPIISNLAVTTRIMITYSRANFFSSGSINRNSALSLHLDLKIISSLQYVKSLSIVCLSLVLKSNESLPKYGKTIVNSLLGTTKLRSFLINNLFKDVLIHWLTKFWGWLFCLNIDFKVSISKWKFS